MVTDIIWVKYRGLEFTDIYSCCHWKAMISTEASSSLMFPTEATSPHQANTTITITNQFRSSGSSDLREGRDSLKLSSTSSASALSLSSYCWVWLGPGLVLLSSCSSETQAGGAWPGSFPPWYRRWSRTSSSTEFSQVGRQSPLSPLINIGCRSGGDREEVPVTSSGSQ